MKKVLLVYETLDTPSTMVRGLQFRDCFDQDAELEATFIGRTDERVNSVLRHWPRRAGLGTPAAAVESSVLRRREKQIVEMARRSDVVVMLTVPSWKLHQQLAALPNTRLVTDLIDALWLPTFQEHGWQHIHEMLASSDVVICENEYTARYCRERCGQVEIVPDAPQLEAFDELRSQFSSERKKAGKRQAVIGWVGGKYTADALYKIFEPLEQLFSDREGLHLRLVGADPDRIPRFEKVDFSVVPRYDQRRMIEETLAMDIGIFPMFDVDESLYRGTLKTRIYMASETAVVGQRLGENETLILDGENGLLAGSDEDWIAALSRLVDDAEERKALASRGLECMREDYSRASCYSRLRDVLLRA